MRQGLGMTSPRTRLRMVEKIRERGVTDERVLDIMQKVPRHLFVDESLSHNAYSETVLPIGHHQTISSPFIVAFMTATLLKDRKGRKPLGNLMEIGVGCGYQTAILAPFCKWVHGIDRISSLVTDTKKRLRSMGVANNEIIVGDAWEGWPDKNRRFDTILCAAAAKEVAPDPVKNALAIGGRFILPIENSKNEQHLYLITRADEDTFEKELLSMVRFVPLVQGNTK